MQVNSQRTTDNTQPLQLSGWRLKWYTIIFEADTVAGRRFDVLLVWAIIISLLVIMVDSMKAFHDQHEQALDMIEWLFTIVFTLEYLARLLVSPSPMRYAKSFLGVIDLISIIPSFVALVIPDAYVLLDVRILRLLRIFRILKMSAYVEEYQWLLLAVAESRRKILVFISIIFAMVVIVGTLMYVVEGAESGFTSVPTSIYWAITTITTVGFGDITPKTDFGRVISSIMMIFGWGILAVPTGIVSAEMIAQHALKKSLEESTTRTCLSCMSEGHTMNAVHCFQCGVKLTQYFGEAPELNARIAYAASMIYMINADGRIEPEEIKRLIILFKDDRKLLEMATRYVNHRNAEEFLENCKNLLNRDQKLSLLVNIYDAILAEGEAHQNELELFKLYMTTFEFTDEQFAPYFHSIAIKNNKDLFRA